MTIYNHDPLRAYPTLTDDERNRINDLWYEGQFRCDLCDGEWHVEDDPDHADCQTHHHAVADAEHRAGL